jgi:hypothetical protein
MITIVSNVLSFMVNFNGISELLKVKQGFPFNGFRDSASIAIIVPEFSSNYNKLSSLFMNLAAGIARYPDC